MLPKRLLYRDNQDSLCGFSHGAALTGGLLLMTMAFLKPLRRLLAYHTTGMIPSFNEFSHEDG